MGERIVRRCHRHSRTCAGRWGELGGDRRQLRPVVPDSSNLGVTAHGSYSCTVNVVSGRTVYYVRDLPGGDRQQQMRSTAASVSVS